MVKKCPWCVGDEKMEHYHDTVWGVPEYDDKALFAKLILDGAQAGLSWRTILYRQEGYYAVFDNLDPEKMAHYSEKRIQKILRDERIIRNKLKVRSAVTNAQAYLKLKDSGVSFSNYLWKFVDGKPVVNSWSDQSQCPATSKESDAMSKALKKDGFKFVGSTIVYAFMQAVGMVNDHLTDCFRYRQV